jgi:hypothetical protein
MQLAIGVQRLAAEREHCRWRGGGAWDLLAASSLSL